MGGGTDTIVGESVLVDGITINSFELMQVQGDGGTEKVTAIFADVDDISKVHHVVQTVNGNPTVTRSVLAATLSKETLTPPDSSLPGLVLTEATEAWKVWLPNVAFRVSSIGDFREAYIVPTSASLAYVSV